MFVGDLDAPPETRWAPYPPGWGLWEGGWSWFDIVPTWGRPVAPCHVPTGGQFGPNRKNALFITPLKCACISPEKSSVFFSPKAAHLQNGRTASSQSLPIYLAVLAIKAASKKHVPRNGRCPVLSTGLLWRLQLMLPGRCPHDGERQPWYFGQAPWASQRVLHQSMDMSMTVPHWVRLWSLSPDSAGKKVQT